MNSLGAQPGLLTLDGPRLQCLPALHGSWHLHSTLCPTAGDLCCVPKSCATRAARPCLNPRVNTYVVSSSLPFRTVPPFLHPALQITAVQNANFCLFSSARSLLCILRILSPFTAQGSASGQKAGVTVGNDFPFPFSKGAQSRPTCCS